MFPRTASNTYRQCNTLHSQIGKVNALPSLFICNRRGQPAFDADFTLQGHTVPQIPTTSDMLWQDICNIEVISQLASLAKSIIYVIYLLKINIYIYGNQPTPAMQDAACVILSHCFHCLPHIVHEISAPSCPSTEEPRVGGGHWYLASRCPGSQGCKPRWSSSHSKAKVVLENKRSLFKMFKSHLRGLCLSLIATEILSLVALLCGRRISISVVL